MNSTVTRLDQMLYAWLAESDNMKFDRAFKKYYDEAFTVLVRYLARRSGASAFDLEQIAVDALLKFFSRVGRERRDASELVLNALPHIQSLDFDAFHIRHVRRWTTDIGSFRNSTMTFVPETQDERMNLNWKAQIHSLAERIPPLQRQGCHVLDPVRAAVVAISGIELPIDRVEESAPADDTDDYASLRSFANRLRSEAREGTADLSAVELKHPGAIRFIDGTWTVIEALPRLRVPTNGYLFDIAQNLYLDECKARGRQKRGGSGFSVDQFHTAHPLGQISLGDDTSSGEDSDEVRGTPTAMFLGGDLADAALDPETDRVGEDFCQQFYAYLRQPLDAAEEDYRIAAANGSGKTERKRLDSVSRKTERLIAVLSMRVEGETQEAIAEAMGISRNQVKYIVELIQESYEQFAGAAKRAVVRQFIAGDLSHEQ